jgi:hypothetical protein
LSYKVLQLSPQASTDVIKARTAIRDSWNASLTSSREIGLPASWLEDESDLDGERNSRDAISGLALSIAFSTSVWCGVALIVARVLR